MKNLLQCVKKELLEIKSIILGLRKPVHHADPYQNGLRLSIWRSNIAIVVSYISIIYSISMVSLIEYKRYQKRQTTEIIGLQKQESKTQK